MVQFNLLPDIKVQYLKAKRQKHLVVLISTIAIIAAVSFLVIMGAIVEVLQKKNLSDLNADIKTASSELENTENLTKILTVQNQLKALPALHDKKVVTSRLFTYVSQLTPSQASIGKLDVDFATNTLTINGSADGLTTVNVFTDTLKFTTYSVNAAEVSSSSAAQGAAKNAFKDVVLASFGRDAKTATYTIKFKFDPAIFSEISNVKLTVPSIITTRSEVAKPPALFQKTEDQ